MRVCGSTKIGFLFRMEVMPKKKLGSGFVGVMLVTKINY